MEVESTRSSDARRAAHEGAVGAGGARGEHLAAAIATMDEVVGDEEGDNEQGAEDTAYDAAYTRAAARIAVVDGFAKSRRRVSLLLLGEENGT